MKIKVLGLCRGDGKLYIKVKSSKPVSAQNFAAKLWGEGRLFPINCYPAGLLPERDLGDSEPPRLKVFNRKASNQEMPSQETADCDSFVQEANGSVDLSKTTLFWVLEVPVLEIPSVEVEFLHQGQPVGFLPINYSSAKWFSRFNYKTKKELCASIRNYEESFTKQQFQIKILNYFESEDGVIWRTVLSWQGDSAKRPVLNAFDGKGNQIPFKQYFFEFQPACSTKEPNKLFLSIELPESQKYFYLVAAETEEQSVVFAHGVAGSIACKEGDYYPGFCSMHEEAYEGYKYGSWLYMKDARADDKAYQKWFEHHRVQKNELIAQQEKVIKNAPLISIVIPCYQSNKLFLLQMIKSVVKQSYANWELLLLDASPEEETVAQAAKAFYDKRIRYINLGENKGIVGNTNEGIRAAKGKFVAFLDHDDLLEPDALYCYFMAMKKNPNAKVFYCDEDLFEKPGKYIQPVFKTPLNLDLLYSHNCVTHFLMIDRKLLLRMGLSTDEVSGAQDYDLTLRAYEKGAEFCHVARVLYHWRIHEGSTSGDNLGGKPYAEEAGRLALQKHLERRGINAKVTTTDHLFVYRVKYALPDPVPYVSIIIPNKDHVDMLDACISSIINKTTYTNYEIVVVENNSVEPETFKYYERLQYKHGQVRVVTWKGEFNYSKIINFGVQQARGKYLLLLNNDTEVITPNFIEEMLGYLQRPEVGVVGAKLYFRDNLVQHAGMLVGVHGAVAHVNQNFSKTREGYLARAVRPGNFSGVTGACQMVSRDVFEKVGGYTETLAVGFNDIDFCLKVGHIGYRITFTPYAELHHYEFVSRGREIADPEKLERWEKEKQEFTTRWGSVFKNGDPFTNTNLDKNSSYYALSED